MSSDVSILAMVPRSMTSYSRWQYSIRNVFSALMSENKWYKKGNIDANKTPLRFDDEDRAL